MSEPPLLSVEGQAAGAVDVILKDGGTLRLSRASGPFVISLFTAPVVLGVGKKLFADGSAPHSFQLTRSRVAPNGQQVRHAFVARWCGGEIQDAHALQNSPHRSFPFMFPPDYREWFPRQGGNRYHASASRSDRPRA